MTATNPIPTQKITPCLAFNGQAEEAIAFYTSIFKNAEIVRIIRNGAAGPGPAGGVLGATIRLNGQEFMVLNGGPNFFFAPGISLFVHCQTQEEIDDLWEKLSAGGEKGRCGWLRDQYGVSWQIVPPVLGEMLQDKDARKANNVMQAMLQMDKIEVNTLMQAYAQG